MKNRVWLFAGLLIVSALLFSACTAPPPAEQPAGEAAPAEAAAVEG